MTVDEDEDEEDEEEVEDEDTDEIYAESRFPAWFLPMRMGRWFPSGNCQQGWRCMFALPVFGRRGYCFRIQRNSWS